MEYAQNFDRAAEYALAALAKMRELGIPANPNNYTIWYHYYSDSYPDMKRTVDVLLDNNQDFTDEQCAKLFESYFGSGEEGVAVQKAAASLQKTLEKAVGHLGKAGSDAADFGAAVKDVAGSLGAIGNDGDLGKIVNEIIDVTRQMEARTEKLEEQLAESSAEVSHLRVEIESARHEAWTDSLTGIGNRKMFDGTLRSEAAAAMEAGEDLCLLMLDIDFFKKFNDTHGHQIGDQVLKLLAATLIENIKGNDSAARYGGEEFTVILPKTALRSATQVAETIRQRLAKKSIINRRTGKHLGSITLSIGVAQFEFGEPLTQWISRADAALYSAKNRGRNRVVTATSTGQPEHALGA